MKRTIKRHLLVYGCALLLIAGLIAGTRVYVSRAQQKLVQAKHDAVTQTQADVDARLAKVKVVEILPVPFTDMLILPGTVRAHAEIDLASKLNGVIEWIGPTEGDRVTKGTKVLQVDVKSVQTRVAETQARYDQALKEYERAQRLHRDQIISKNQLDQATTRLETTKAALDAASVNLGDGTLYSPITGILDRLDVDRGEYIDPGQTVMKIVDIDQVYIELPVPEKDILYFKKGQPVDIEMSRAGQSHCKHPKEIDGQQRCWLTGTITFISMTADSATRTYIVKVLVNNSTGILRPGMIVRAHLVRRELDEAIAVPFFTMIDREQGKAVFVVEDGVARTRQIQYGTFEKGLVEIRRGLEIGDRLVLVGQRGLVDGQHVEVTQDVTPLAKQWIAQGKDLSELPIDIVK
jgi:membrane fusion protein (multidrug efflux system)